MRASDWLWRLFILIVVATLTVFAYRQILKNRNAIDSKAPLEQINKLDQISKDLKSLEDYISEQKNKVLERERIVEDLKIEQKEIEPLLKTNQEIVDALFIQQNKYQEKSKWIERGYGFMFGILASLIASFIYEEINPKMQNHKE